MQDNTKQTYDGLWKQEQACISVSFLMREAVNALLPISLSYKLVGEMYAGLTKSLTALKESGGQALTALVRADCHVTAVQAQWLGGGERWWQQLQLQTVHDAHDFGWKKTMRQCLLAATARIRHA